MAIRVRRRPTHPGAPGEAAGLDADYETLDLAKALVPSAFRGYVPARHPAAGLLVVIEVEVLAAALETSRRMHQAVTERAALSALVLYRGADWSRHPVSVGPSTRT